MNTITAYTPLESLLLFQSLATNGTDPTIFSRTSDLLKNNALVKDGDSFDAGRLSPDALRELYLQLLREELRGETLGDGSEDASPSKKRKIQNALPTVKDGSEHNDKLPQLVDRLYARYREHMIRSIREDERKYELLQKDIAEIERGEWDERLAKEERARANKHPSAPAEDSKPRRSGSRTPSQTGSNVKQADIRSYGVTQTKDQPSQSPGPSLQTDTKPEGLAISDVLNSQESVPERYIESEGRNGQSLPPINHQRTPSSDRHHGPSPLQPPRPGDNHQWEQYPPQYPGYSPYAPQYPQYPGPPRGSFSGHLPPPVPSSPLNNSHPHPIVLPPPNIGRGPVSPARPLEALADIAEQQQYRAPANSPLVGAGFNQSYGGYPSYRSDGRPTSGNGLPPPQWNPQYPPQYPVSGYNYSHPVPFSRPDIPQGQRQYNSPYNVSQGPRPNPEQYGPSSTPRLPHLRANGPHTPASGRSLYSTGRATNWTPNPTASTPKVRRSPSPPPIEPISPILLPRKSQSKPKNETSGGRGRRGAQRTRAGSTPSSAIAGTYRSQSAVSQVDELSLDNERPTVKQESATPMPVEETGDTTADESTSRVHRLASRRVHKRKRESPEREPVGPPTTVLWTRNFPKISASALERIGAHRSASTFALPIKDRDAPGYSDIILRPQDLKSIRASINAGYKAGAALDDRGLASVMLPISEDLVPPKAIVNNSQLEKELMHMFANAIMYNPDPSRGFGRSFEAIKSVEVPGSENYDFDENSVVKDTRAMFADVEKIVGEMRSAERRSEEGAADAEDEDVDELAGDGEHGGTIKRRRKA